GELFIAGPLLARGYVSAPDATALRFIADPFGDGGDRLYRTGDLARWRDDGQLLFHGRTDHQLKVLGHRIDPTEVESALVAHPQLGQAAVAATTAPDGSHRLTAWIVPADPHAPPSAADLRAFLTPRLPAQLLPAVIHHLPDLPRTATGKVNRRALPQPAV